MSLAQIPEGGKVYASNDVGTTAAPNWASFYSALLWLGPSALVGIPPEWVDWFQEEGSSSEWFWYEGIQEEFFDNWEESPELAVAEAFQHYVLGVQSGLKELPFSANCAGWTIGARTGALLTWDESILSIKGELSVERLQELVAAALAHP
jgi:hypothetical protein